MAPAGASTKTLTTHIGANTKQLDASLIAARKKIGAFTAAGMRSFALLTGAAVGAGGIAAVAIAFKKITESGVAFEQSMTTAGAVMRATAQEMTDLTAIAREMGATTEWTATQSAEALQFLGMAGFNATQSIAALPGVLDLATAGGLDLGRAADIATNALTAMGLEVEELERVNDVFIGTITRSNTNMEMMAESFKYAAPIARAFGYSIEELSAMIGMLGNAGVQGSSAGTQLAMAIQKANKIAVRFGFESADLVDVLEDLNAAGMDGQAMFDLFGVRAGRAALILKDATQGTKDFQEVLGGVGGEAETLADKMRGTLGGAFKELKSVIESVGLDIFATYRDDLRAWVKNLSESTREHAQDIVDFAYKVRDAFDLAKAAIIRVTEILANATRAYGEYFNSFEDATGKVAIDDMKTAINALVHGGRMAAEIFDFLLTSFSTMTASFIKDFIETVRPVVNILQDLKRAAGAVSIDGDRFHVNVDEITLGLVGALKELVLLQERKDSNAEAAAELMTDNFDGLIERMKTMEQIDIFAASGRGVADTAVRIAQIGDLAAAWDFDLSKSDYGRAPYQMGYDPKGRRRLPWSGGVGMYQLSGADRIHTAKEVQRGLGGAEGDALKRTGADRAGRELNDWAYNLSRDMHMTFRNEFFKMMKGEFTDLADFATAIAEMISRQFANILGRQASDWIINSLPGATMYPANINVGGTDFEGPPAPMGKFEGVEQVATNNTGASKMGGTVTVIQNIQNPINVDEFQRSQNQLMSKAHAAANRANRRFN